MGDCRLVQFGPEMEPRPGQDWMKSLHRMGLLGLEGRLPGSNGPRTGGARLDQRCVPPGLERRLSGDFGDRDGEKRLSPKPSSEVTTCRSRSGDCRSSGTNLFNAESGENDGFDVERVMAGGKASVGAVDSVGD